MATPFRSGFLETIGVYVSMLNACNYCVEHHFQGMLRLVGDDERSNNVRKALEERRPEEVFEGKELALLKYAEKLTRAPFEITELDIQNLRQQGVDDGEVLEVNQVTAYFSYANRTVLGLGVNTDGDIIGLSPNENDDPDNWNHY